MRLSVVLALTFALLIGLVRLSAAAETAQVKLKVEGMS